MYMYMANCLGGLSVSYHHRFPRASLVHVFSFSSGPISSLTQSVSSQYSPHITWLRIQKEGPKHRVGPNSDYEEYREKQNRPGI